MASGPDDTTSPRDGRRDRPDAPGRVPPVDTDRAPGQARSNRYRRDHGQGIQSSGHLPAAGPALPAAVECARAALELTVMAMRQPTAAQAAEWTGGQL